MRDESNEVTRQWDLPSLSWKAKVVWGSCNQTWMSGLESKHAKPAMTDLMVGKGRATITQSDASGIAPFGLASFNGWQDQTVRLENLGILATSLAGLRP
jgi:hypothetical protein